MILFETNRMRVHSISKCDVEDLQHILTDEQSMKHSKCGPLKQGEIHKFISTEIKAFYNSNFCYWSMKEKNSGNIIGLCGFNTHQMDQQEVIHINYRLASSSLNQGYATEVVFGMVQYAREILSLNNLYALITPDNSKSIDVVERCHFKLVKPARFKNMQVNIYQIHMV